MFIEEASGWLVVDGALICDSSLEARLYSGDWLDIESYKTAWIGVDSAQQILETSVQDYGWR